VKQDAASHENRSGADTCAPDYLCVQEGEHDRRERQREDKPQANLKCYLRTCPIHAPNNLCEVISCSSNGTTRTYGLLEANLLQLRSEPDLFGRFLSKVHLLEDAVKCLVEHRPSEKGVLRLVWFKIQLHTDGHLSLLSARSFDHRVPSDFDVRGNGKPNREIGLCIEKALIGKTLHDPKYVDAESPRARFPEVVLKFEGDVRNDGW